MVQVFGTKSCKGTQKAQRFFKERKKEFQFRDLSIKGLAPRELDDALRCFTVEELLDTEAKTYRDRGLQYMDFDIREELLSHPELIRTPLVRDGTTWILGINEGSWKALI